MKKNGRATAEKSAWQRKVFLDISMRLKYNKLYKSYFSNSK